MNLEERFYTSTEVAEILGVSLRSVYRYLEEDKMNAEIKTATGRHRFTKQNILDFLYPSGDKTQKQTFVSADKIETAPVEVEVVEEEEVAKEEVSEETSVEPIAEKEEKEEKEGEESAKGTRQEEPPVVDWLAKFRAAAEKHRLESEVQKETETQTEASDTEIKEEEHVSGLVSEEEQKPQEKEYIYYRSGIGGLKDIAQALDKTAKKSSLDYAFTLNAGISLHKPIKPFSVLHAYVRRADRDFFERMLQLSETNKSNAQLCLIYSDEDGIYRYSKEMHGLRVVSDLQLKADLMEYGEEELARDLE